MDLEAYLAVRERLDPIVRASDCEIFVPACPAWRVRDVIAHLAGLCEDWVEHRLDGYATDAWTEAQVSRFAELSIAEMLERWGHAATRFAALGDDARMGSPTRWAFGDAVTHEADIRGALTAGRVPHDAVLLALQGEIGRWRQVLREANTTALLLRARDARDWWLGESEDPDAVVGEAPAYEVFRALAGRRSARQVGRWTWTGDPAQYVTAGLPYPFRWASVDIND